MKNITIVMWKRGLLGFAMGEKKRGKLGKCEGMRKSVPLGTIWTHGQ